MKPSEKNVPHTPGVHRGGDIDEEPTTSVRAPMPPDPHSEEGRSSSSRHRLFYNEEEGTYRVISWHVEPIDVADPNFREVGSYSHDELDELVAHLPEREHYIVLENPETGEVVVQREQLLNNWLSDGQYMQLTVFTDEQAALAYADDRRQQHGRS